MKYRGLANILTGLLGVALACVLILFALRIPRVALALDGILRRCVPAPGAWRDDLRLILDGTPVDVLPCVSFLHKDAPDAEFTNVIRYNNYSFHDEDWTLEKPPGTFRILLIGDSYAQGNEVAMRDGFPYRVERLLAADGKPVEIVNMGLQTLNTADELGLYAVLGQQFHADLVLLAFFVGNDIWDNGFGSATVGSPPMVLDADGQLAATVPTVEFSLDPARFPQSPAYQWFAGLHAAGRMAEPPPVPSGYAADEFKLYAPEDTAWARARHLTEALLAQFKTLAEAEGSAFAVIIVPDRRAVYAQYLGITLTNYPADAPLLDVAGAHTAYAEYLRESGTPVLNLQPLLAQFAANRPQEHLYFPVDGHFSAAGHALAAGLIARWLSESGLIP